MTEQLVSSGGDVLAARLVEQLTDLLQAGGDAEAFIAAHPDQEEMLRRLLPAVRMMADLSRSGEPGASATGVIELGELGDFRLIREVGRGGMGIVYEAEQISLRRRVALKVLPFAATMDPRHLQRFHNEALAAASLHHEHIAPVHGVGCERGVHYYAMQFIDGMTLAEIIGAEAPKVPPSPGLAGEGTGVRALGCSEIQQPPSPLTPLPPSRERGTGETAPIAALTTERAGRNRDFFRRIAALVADAADALEHAHLVGIVHRDVKPGNLMVDAAGKLWVADFGLARFGTDAGLTMSGDLLGTLRYMAPEQAMARHGLADHRVDIYGLGCTLYELLTGKPALVGEDKADILRHIAFEEPIAPRKLDKAIPAELETIALKCLAKEPKERYGTAGELAADLRRFANDRPIHARRPTAGQIVSRWARRHRGWVVFFGLVAGVTVAAVWAWYRETANAMAAAVAVEIEADDLRKGDRLPEALQAARRAADLLPRFGGNPNVRRSVLERKADLQLVWRLEEARLESSFGAPRGGMDHSLGGPQFAQAFLDYGVDVLSGDESFVAASLGRRAVASDIAFGLADWSKCFGSRSTEQERLQRLAVAVDPDPRQTVAQLYHINENGSQWPTQLASNAISDLPPISVLSRIYFGDFPAPVAKELLRAGQRQYPTNFWINTNLGNYCYWSDKSASEGIRFYTAALAVRPQSAPVWHQMGRALASQGRYEEAVAAYRRALAYRPDDYYSSAYLGLVLIEMGRLTEAELPFREAIRQGPKWSSEFYCYYCDALLSQGRLTEAELLCRHAKTVLTGTNHKDACGMLGRVLVRHGRFPEAVAEMQAASDAPVFPQRWVPPASMVTDTERMAILAPQLPALLDGRAKVQSPRDEAILGLICQKHNAEYLAALRHFTTAFATDPKLFEEAGSFRYCAACAAARIGCGRSGDAANLDAAGRARWRRQSLVWLTAELTAQAAAIETPERRNRAICSLFSWRVDDDLRGVSEDYGRPAMSEEERKDWQAFWTETGRVEGRWRRREFPKLYKNDAARK